MYVSRHSLGSPLMMTSFAVEGVFIKCPLDLNKHGCLLEIQPQLNANTVN